MIEYSIITPVYNEEAAITSSLTQIVNFLNNFTSSYEVLVVDDGSTDKTLDVLETYIQLHQQIRVIKNQHKGKGYAVRTGVLVSTGDYVLMCDADMSTPIEEIKRLLVWIEDSNFDIAIASREGIGATRNNEPYIRHIMGRVFNMLIRFLLLPGIQDTQCGFKLFKGNVAREIFKRTVLFGDPAPTLKKSRVTAFDVEILVIAKRSGYKIKEVPVTWTYGPGSKVNPLRDSFKNLADVLKIKYNDLLGKYLS